MDKIYCKRLIVGTKVLLYFCGIKQKAENKQYS